MIAVTFNYLVVGMELKKEQQGGEEINQKILAFNMGWLNFPKASWRSLGLYLALVGLGFIVFFPLTQTIVLASKQSGIILMLVGAFISTVNG